MLVHAKSIFLRLSKNCYVFIYFHSSTWKEFIYEMYGGMFRNNFISKKALNTLDYDTSIEFDSEEDTAWIDLQISLWRNE